MFYSLINWSVCASDQQTEDMKMEFCTQYAVKATGIAGETRTIAEIKDECN